MILHRVAVRNVGPFVGEEKSVGPFAPGLNILSAPNETGKTTLLKAAGRALFDRHTCKADEIKNLRPAGTTLAPTVTVDFQTAAGRFQIEKTFLQAPRSQLSEHAAGEWRLVADGDAADDRLNALLQSTKPGSGATKVAAHWGMLGFLWMRQGELAEWPEWQKAAAGPAVQSLLVKVEIDPFIAAVQGRMWSVFTENFTPSTHQPKVGGNLLTAEGELTRAEVELAEIARTRQQLATDQEAFDRVAGELPRLEEEHARCRQTADTLREEAGRVRIVQAEIDTLRHQLTTARERLKTVQNDEQAVRDHVRRGEELAGKLAAAHQEAARREREAAAARQRLRAAEAAREENARLLAEAQAELTRASRLLRHRRLTDDIARTVQTLARATDHAASVTALAAARAELPTIPPAKLAHLEKLHEAIQTGRARVTALGLTVELTPLVEGAAATARADGGTLQDFVALPADRATTVQADQTLTLELPGWGTVRLSSGAGEVRALRATLASDESSLRQEVEALGVRSPGEARELAHRARDLDRRLAEARKALAGAIGEDNETPESLRARLARDRRLLGALATEIGFCSTDVALANPEPEGAEQAAVARCEARRTEAKTLERRAKEGREGDADARERREEAERAVLLLGAESDNLQRLASGIRARHPGGLEAALQEAGEAFALASFALKEAEKRLPPAADTLPERHRRAATAAEQVSLALEHGRARQAELRGKLELGGSSGLHGREATLLIRRDALRTQVTQARARSRAARLVHDLIARRRQAATRAVLAPLQERLGARFAEVSGERERRIFLDESLTVRGLGRQDGELVNFGELSQGAKEQLLLCLRLAIAEELATGGEGAQSLILDDVLVNTDAARQDRILTLLASAAAGGLQILVCTCHPDRYRGVGQVIPLRRD